MEKDLIQSIREIGQKLTAFENMLDNSGIKKAEDLAIFRANINEHLNQVYEKDCLQFLRNVESESVDGVVTDPPYCSGGFNESGKAGAKGQGLRSDVIKEVGWFINDRMTTAGLVWLLRNVMIELHRILKDGGSVCLFTDWRMVVHIAPALESAGFRFQNMIVWNKMAMGLGVGFRHQHEIILHFVFL